MARTYHTVIPPRRRWGLAAGAALTALALAAGLGNPWSTSFIAGLDSDKFVDRAAVLVHGLLLFHWTTTPSGMAGYGGPDLAARYAGALTLDLGWPFLLFLGTRMVCVGLSPRRGGLALFLGTWGLAGFTGVLSALAAGTVDYVVSGSHSLLSYPGVIGWPLPGTLQLGDALTLMAATMGMLCLALGWLPAIAAVVCYSARRRVVQEVEETGEEPTVVDLSRPVVVGAAAERETLDLAALEALRNARYGTGSDMNSRIANDLADPRTSTFFGDGQY